MPLDPNAQALINELAVQGLLPTGAMPVSQARVTMRKRTANLSEPKALYRVEDRLIPCPAHQIPIRIFVPSASTSLPALVYFHGGGWVLGGIDTHEGFCQHLADAAVCIIVMVDYRLAPEHQFPAGLEDCYTAVQWVFANATALNVDPARISVGGDSAGGNLAAAVSLLARDRGGPHIASQVLIYPITDYWLPGTPSYLECATGYTLGRDTMIWFWSHYRPGLTELDNPYLCPLRAQNLNGLPPAHVITAEFDPLRDEGERYAARLKEAGVPVQFKRYEGMPHNFILYLKRFVQAREVLNDAAQHLSSVAQQSPS